MNQFISNRSYNFANFLQAIKIFFCSCDHFFLPHYLLSLIDYISVIFDCTLDNHIQSSKASQLFYAEVPPRVEYSLSDLGNTLRPIISVMETWGIDYKKLNEDTSTDTDE
nr:winged helix-turn-helix transcriptional regulator [Paenibacillus xylanexedens]